MTDDAGVAELARRVDQMESRAAIESLIGRYTHGFDRADRQLLREIWHEDAVLDLGEPFGSFSGLAEILEGAEAFWRENDWMHHWCANSTLTIDGDLATGVVNLNCMVRNREDGPVNLAGHYYDGYQRRNGEWKFSHRRFVLDYWTPIDQWSPTLGPQR